MSKCIVRKRELDGSERIVAIITEGPMTAEVLRLGFANTIKGRALFGVEAVPEVEEISFFKKLVLKHNKDKIKEDKAREVLSKLWIELGNVIVDKDDNIEQGWKHFPVGTSKFDIWHWIEETYNVSVTEDLMNCITE